LGYNQFKSLWALSKHPDGLLINPDVCARGAVAACIELGVNVPRDLKLVLHRNAEVKFLCPLSVSWIEMNATQVAEAAVEQVLKQFNGQPVQPFVQPFRLHPLGGEKN
jgi:DNA-binding LacI/PurR family transcriptional regulator